MLNMPTPSRRSPFSLVRFTICVVAILVPIRAMADEVMKRVAVVKPEEYPRALRNPLKGFTNRGFNENNEWATLTHCYIRWEDIESKEADGIDKIRQWYDTKWKGIEDQNMKVIPRVYLHWKGDKKYWPADMENDDYLSEQFKRRVVRLVDRLGQCWDEDPRVAHIEMGIIGKWGEHHSPSPSPKIEKLLGDAFSNAFKNKKVLVRHPWEFNGYSFGIYWDSWAHANQMDSHGSSIEKLGDRWTKQIMGGEVAYDWGRYREQPGESPTDTVTDPDHRGHLINTIRWLHCTQLRWVAAYNQSDPEVRAGAEQVQRAFGYRFVNTEVRYPKIIDSQEEFSVSFDVKNTGSAPFYYRWPIEISVLDPKTRVVVWRDTFKEVDIRQWLPGDRWNVARQDYDVKPKTRGASGSFTLSSSVQPGEYVLALAILDPAGMLPSARFAIRNYFTGGRHPIGMIGVGRAVRSAMLDTESFDDPAEDRTLHYVLGGRTRHSSGR